jgi:hypothetical protein
MEYTISNHARQEMDRRNIKEKWLSEVMGNPEQIVEEYGNMVCYQSRMQIDGENYLIRVIVDPKVDPPRIVTVYRTSKIEKYWRII